MPGEENSAKAYAAVAVDLAVEGADRPFHYRVPPRWRKQISVGHRVRVPFGRRTVEGIVVGFPSAPEVAELKEIEALADEEPILTPELLELACWLSRRYLCLFPRAIRSLLPPGVRRGRVGPLKIPIVKLSVPKAEARRILEAIDGRAYRQRAVVEKLLSAGGSAARADLLRAAGASTQTLRRLVALGLVEITEQEKERDPYAGRVFYEKQVHRLTPDQASAVDRLARAAKSCDPGVFLLHGVTASGKTEVYLRSIEEVLSAGRRAILMVPEIALTPQSVRRFKARFGRSVAVLHSALSPGERYDEWRRIRRGEAAVAVGVRSAVLAPFDNLGLIIIDEEHENTYKQEEIPRYDAREVAIRRAKATRGIVVLGSATPSIESYYRARKGEFGLLELPRRVDGDASPRFDLVDMRTELASGNTSIFSRELAEAIREVIGRGERAVLFLNRRGFSSFVLCRECGVALECHRCDVTLTYHAARHTLKCHHCNLEIPAPRICPECGGNKIHHFGTGTQKVETLCRQEWPEARVIRMDLDTTGTRGAHERIYEAFRTGEANLLIGTQMIAKGWDIPEVTLVGVISADTSLHIPDFRSAERTYQLLTQVAGRAGRGEGRGRVIIQTYNPDHYAIRAALAGDYESFYRAELEYRAGAAYPPYSHLVRIVVSAESWRKAARAAEELGEGLGLLIPKAETERGKRESFLGPAPAPLVRLRGRYRWHLLLKGPDPDALAAAAASVVRGKAGRSGGVRIDVDVDPINML